MEHLEHFGLSREPFINDPVLDFYYASPTHDRAEKRVLRAMLQGKGLCVVFGDAGSGKTILSRHILENLDEDLFEPCMLVALPGGVSGNWLLSRLAAQLGVEEVAEEHSELLGQVFRALVEVREEDRRTVLFVDEAQFLADPSVIDELRSLLNLEYEDQRVISIVLLGQPAVEQALALDAALAQRVDHRIHLEPLDEKSSRKYLVHRVQAAEGTSGLIEPEAIRAIHRLAGGVPRVMNTLADNALFEAHMGDLLKVTLNSVKKAAEEMGLIQDPVAAPSAPPAPAPQAPAAATPQPEPAPQAPVAATPQPEPAPQAPVSATPQPEPAPAVQKPAPEALPSDTDPVLEEEDQYEEEYEYEEEEYEEEDGEEEEGEEEAITLEDAVFGTEDNPLPPGFIEASPEEEVIPEPDDEPDDELDSLFDHLEDGS